MADGSPAIGYEDIKEHTDDVITREPMWLLFKTIEVIQGHSQPKASLAEQIARSSAPYLLISAGSRRRSGASYDRRGGDRSELWYLPKAGHTAALKQYPDAYEPACRRVLRRAPGPLARGRVGLSPAQGR